MKHRYKAIAVATAVVGTWAGSTAHAADLGGNCCADLEERIAELEATTARKGNRKVSLSVTGFVAKQLLFFDDGVEFERLRDRYRLDQHRHACTV